MNYHATDAKHPHVRTFIASLLSYVLLASQLAPLTLGANVSFRSDPANTPNITQKKAPPQRAKVVTNPFAPVPVPLAVAHPALAPNITATKVDTYPSAPGSAQPGEIITYSVTITNSGPDAATNVTLSDTVDPNTTIVGTPKSTPIGIDDAFSVLGNVRIQVPDGASDLLANDRDPDTDTNAGLTITTLAGDNSAPFSGNSAQNGEVTAASGNGSFEYNPPPGFTGSDTFTYIATDVDGDSQPVTVTLTVTGLIWFVNSAAAAGGNGRLTAPFNCYTGTSAPAQTCFSDTAADDPGDIIFLFSGNYIGGITLLNNQRLIGQGATDTLATVGGVTVPTFSDALPATGGASPTITTAIAATNAIPLGQANLLRGFTVGNTTGAKIFGNGFGTLTVGNNVSPDVILNGTGMALNLTNGTFAASSAFSSVTTTSSTAQGILLSQTAGTVAFGSTTVSGSTTQGILVQQSTADINFGNTTVGTGIAGSGGTNAVSLQNNGGGTRTFGTLTIQNINGPANSAFLSGAGGGNTVVGTTNISGVAGTGHGIDIQSLAGGTSVTFGATTVNKASPGSLVNLASNAGNVTFLSLGGTNTNGPGLVGTENTGTITVTNNTGSLTTTLGPAVNITKAAAPATPIDLDFATLSSTNSGTQGVNLDRVSGNMAVTTTTVNNSTGTGIQVQNTIAGGTMNFGTTAVTNTGNANVDATGTGVFLNANAGNVTFGDLDISPDANERAFQSTASTGTITTTSGDITATGNVTLDIVGPAGRTPLAMVLNNLDSTNSNGIGVNLNLVSGNFTVNDATLATSISNPTGIGLQVQSTTGGTMNFGNTVSNASGGTGVFLNANAGAVTFADLDIAPDNNVRAFHATSNTGIITTTSGTLVTTGTGIGVEVTGGTTPLNMTLTSVSTNGAESGIVLNSTTANPAGFVVNGDGTNARNGSGGTITTTTNDGVRLTNANTVTLRSMNLINNGNTIDPDIADNEGSVGEHAVEAIGGSNITLSGVLIDGPSGSGMIALNLTGTNRLNNNSLVTNIDNPQTHGLFIRNTNVNMTLFEVNDTDFTQSSSSASILNVITDGTSNVTVEVENGCVFEALSSQAVTMAGGGTAGTTGTLTSSVVNSTFQNANGNGENNVAALVALGATHNATIEGNTLQNIAKDGTIANTSIIRTQNSGGKLSVIVRNNLIQNIAYGPGLGGRHVIGHVFEPPAFAAANFSNLRFEGNTASNITYQATNREFIFIDYREFASGGDIKVLSNNWNMPSSANTSEAVELRFRQANPSTVRVQVDNNGQGTGAISNTGTRFFRVDVEESANAALTITNNKFTNNNASPGAAIEVRTEDNAAVGGPPTACVNITGNNVTAAGNTIVLNEVQGTMNVTQASGAAIAAANNAAVVTILGTPAFSQPACVLPANASLISKRNESQSNGLAQTVDQAATTQIATTQIATAADSITSRPFISSPRLETPKARANTRTITPTRPTVSSTEPTKDVSFAPTDRPTVGKAKQSPPRTVNPPSVPVVIVAPDGSSLSWNVGTLPAGQSVTITFQVVVDNPFTGPPQVSNQGTVTADGGISVLTDDPSVVGAADPTVTPIDVPLEVSISDATVAEPTSGTTSMLFTVTLSAPATQVTTINYNTADGTAVAPGDYDAVAGGSTVFQIGEQIKVIPITVNSDPDGTEGDETFTITITSGQVTVVDGTATGTITAANVPGTLLISELRTSGPAGSGDDFVEIYNNTDTPHTVTAAAGPGYGVFKMGADCNATPVLVGTIPNGTVIPARGHFLLVGSAYSLANYGGTGAAAGNATMTQDIENDRNVSLFSTTDILQLSTTTRFDAVGFGTNTGAVCDLQREGTNLGAVNGSTLEYSFFRKICNNGQADCPTPGRPKETNDNAADFLFADTTATAVPGAGQLLGAPGPENLASPIKRDPALGILLLDASVTGPAPPNRVRDNTPDAPNNSTFGTMSVRRRILNNTGASVTRLRFRIIDITTAVPPNAAVADIRARTSATVVGVAVNDSGTCAPAAAPCTVTVQGTTLEQPPTQAMGGGYNATLSAGTITLATPLANSASINVQFLLGVQQQGNFRFFIVVEALP